MALPRKKLTPHPVKAKYNDGTNLLYSFNEQLKAIPLEY